MNWKHWLSLAVPAFVGGAVIVLQHALGDGQPLGAKVTEAALIAGLAALVPLFREVPQ